MKKIITFLLVLIFALGAVGCNDKPATDGGNTGGSTVVPNFKEDDVKIVNDGASDYKVVIPDQAKDIEKFAAEELVFFLEKSTGVRLNTVTDAQPAASDKLISVGNTKLVKDEGVAINDAKLGESGYVISTKGNTVIIAGSTLGFGYGALYGVYDYLKFMVGYEYYAETEFHVDEKATLKLKKINYSFVPSFNMRDIGEYETNNNLYYRNRLRLFTHLSDEWGLFGHSNESHILPKSLYYEDHKDWYSAEYNVVDGYERRQLCFTNEEMRVEYVRRLKEIIASKPNSKYFELGQEDTPVYCKCDDCLAEIERLGGNFSGLQVSFLNKVIDEIMPWFNASYPNREIVFIVFAYQISEEAPVKVVNGKYVPYCDEVKLNDNLFVMIAPIETDWSRSITDSTNSASLENIQKWSAVSKKIFLWKYSFYTESFIYPFNNLPTYKATNLEMYKYNVDFMFEEGAVRSNLGAFEQLRMYYQAQLMWNANQNPEELLEKFFENYYKDAATEMRDYYEALTTWQMKLRDENGVTGGVFENRMDKYENWSFQILATFDDMLQKAFDKIEPLKTANPERYQILYDRIEKEKLLSLYYKLLLHVDSCSPTKYLELLNEFEHITGKNKVTYLNNNLTVTEFIKKCRNLV